MMAGVGVLVSPRFLSMEDGFLFQSGLDVRGHPVLIGESGTVVRLQCKILILMSRWWIPGRHLGAVGDGKLSPEKFWLN